MTYQNFQVLSFSVKRPPHIQQIVKYYSTISGKAKITAIEKIKNIQIELTGEEIQRKIERITQEVQ